MSACAGALPGQSAAREAAPVLRAQAVSVAVGARQLVAALDLQVRPGEFLVVLGRNGSGKTLTLQTLAGLRPAAAGTVELDGMPLDVLGRRRVAQRLGVLSQDSEAGLGGTVLESVLIGRHPHLGFLQWESAADRELALDCLARVGLTGLAGRALDTLSGGEQRRAAIAAVLVQQPQLYLLDEPTNHLDPHHQLAALELFRDLTRTGASVLATLHDPTLAARFADRVLLLFGAGDWRAGTAQELLTAQSLGELYQTPMLQLEAAGRRVFATA